ncbi:photosystem II stability/assembly factor-like uncharacterized protein [Oxalobacteraceae bacterium GrIS 2.11]
MIFLMKKTYQATVLAISVAVASGSVMAQEVKLGTVPAPKQTAAVKLANPAPDGLILGAIRIGQRVVTVGDRGVILLSDDQGKTWHQAQEVPTRATLTAVFAVDEKNLWAVGHWGVILHSVDGGEHWLLNHSDLEHDQPMFTVWFADAQHGVVAGLFSLLMVTDDGGQTWSNIKLPVASDKVKSDLNLFRLFSGKNDAQSSEVWIAAEQGMVYHSTDRGHSWDVVATGNKGTLWSGILLSDGALLVGGLEGKMLKSSDHGKTWKQISSDLKSSVTELLQLPDGTVFALALDGVSAESKDGGEHFTLRTALDSRSFTAAVVSDQGKLILFTDHGMVKN